LYLGALIRRTLLDQSAAEDMGAWDHGGGFVVDASVCIAGADRPGLERLLRCCARPPFALEHLQQLDAEHLEVVRLKFLSFFVAGHIRSEPTPARRDRNRRYPW
jgi:hypothetical protein